LKTVLLQNQILLASSKRWKSCALTGFSITTEIPLLEALCLI
jgi:hypothetical protein